VSILGPKIGKNGVLLGGTYEHPIGDKLFQDIPRRAANLRENRPRDVENLVDGKKIKQ